MATRSKPSPGSWAIGWAVAIPLTRIEALKAVNAIYTRDFPECLPASALVQIDAVMSNAESTPPQA